MAGLLQIEDWSKKLLMWSYVFYMAVSIPEFMLMNQKSFALALVGLLIGIIPYCQAGTYSSMPELFPTQIQHSGVAFSHSVGAVDGGSGPYLSLRG